MGGGGGGGVVAVVDVVAFVVGLYLLVLRLLLVDAVCFGFLAHPPRLLPRLLAQSLVAWRARLLGRMPFVVGVYLLLALLR